MLQATMRIHDWATKYVQDRAKAAAQAHGGALSSAGFRLKQLITQGMRQEAPGGEPWPKASSWLQFGTSLAGRARAQSRRLARRKRAPKSPPPVLYGTKGRTPLKKLAAGARYEKTGSSAETRVRIGFLNPRLAQLAAYHAVAHDVPVTPKMRRLIFAVGLGIAKRTIHIPARPHVDPVYRKNQAHIAGFCEKRVKAAWAGKDPKAIEPTF